MMRLTQLLAAIALCFSLSSQAGEETSVSSPIPANEEAPQGGEFTLESAHGAVSLSDFRGKVVVLNFGYAGCPDVCPVALSYMSRSIDRLSEAERQRVQGIFVSLDPARDTPKYLEEYTRYFNDRIMGLTASDAVVAEVAARYGVNYYTVEVEGSPLGYSVNHSAATYLISQDGTLRFLFPHATSAVTVSKAMQYLLHEQNN